MTSKKLAVIAELREHDHAIVTPAYASKVAKHFGFKPEIEVIFAEPPSDTSKGVFLNGGAKSVRGVGAADLARQICHHLGVDYELCGEGGTLRSCCDDLTAHFKKRQA
jgi:hypothetical protein